jgi:hypothetical protein
MSTTGAFIDLSRGAPVAMLDQAVSDRRAWTRDTMSARDWTVPLSAAAVAEIEALAETLARQPLPVLVLTPEAFALPECRAAMARTKAMDGETADALAALGDVMRDDRLWIEFTIQRGQLQYLNNREFAHYRSEFKDDATHNRHLSRRWFREHGRRFYAG